MHYSIALLNKKVTYCVTLLLFMEINLLLRYSLSPGLSLLVCFVNNKKAKSYIFVNCKGTKSEMNNPQAEGRASVSALTPDFSQHARQDSCQSVNGKTK